MKDKWRLPAGIVEGIYLGELNVTGLNYVESLSCDIGKYLKHQENMDDYIQLTRFISSDGMDRINCDWCSIVNGMSEFYISTMKGNKGYDILKTSSFLFYLNYYEAKLIGMIPKSYFVGYEECSDEDVNQFIVDNDIKVDSVIEEKLLKFYLKRVITLIRIFAHIETRWCPFGYMQDMAYERNYHGTDLGAIVTELRQFGKVVCTSCVSKLNQSHGIVDAKESIYADFVSRAKKYANA
jgi:hypothetical protein